MLYTPNLICWHIEYCLAEIHIQMKFRRCEKCDLAVSPGVCKQVGMTVKSNPGSNSDIDNRSDPDLVLLHMLSGCLYQRFNHHLADKLLKTDSVLHTKTA